MSERLVQILAGLLAISVLSGFVIGLAHSISTGFAGFWGGFPFWVIACFVLGIALYDYVDSFWPRSSKSRQNS